MKKITSNKSKKVSIIIPTYGRPDYLNRAINSVLKQDFKNIEIIVVDDNSNTEMHEATSKIMLAYSTNTKVVYYHDYINRGGALARNKGIELSSGEYITFLDDDDFYSPNKISEQVLHIEKNNLDVSVCDMFFIRDGKKLNISNCYARVDSAIDFVLFGNAYTPMIMAKKQSLKKVDFFTDTPRYQDHVLMLKFFIANQCIGHLNQKLFTHNDHNGPRITNTPKFETAYNIRCSFEKKIIPLMTPKEYNRYQLNDMLIRAKILRFNRNNFNAYNTILQAFKKVSSATDVIKVLKTFIRISLFKNRPI